MPLFDGWSKVGSTAESGWPPKHQPAPRWRPCWHHWTYGGEPKYPIGWPRVSRAFKGDERDWSGFDYSSSASRRYDARKLHPTPLTLQVRMDVAEGTWSRPL